jgi:hypothetical protein
MKLKIDWISIKGAIRTAGALVVGNFFVAILAFSNTEYAALAIVFLIGAAAIIGTSIQSGEKS